MAINSAELLAGELSRKVEGMLSELIMLRRECARKSECSLMQEKAFVAAYQNEVMARASRAVIVCKLERMLLVR